MNQRTKIAAAVATGLLVMVGCDSPDKVSGRLDDTKHVAAKYRTATRTVDVTRTKCRNVVKTSMIGKTTVTRTEVQCSPVKVGTRTEQYTESVRPARWCIELDNVNGKGRRDNRWYEVNAATYRAWSGKEEGTKIKDMTVIRKGC